MIRGRLRVARLTLLLTAALAIAALSVDAVTAAVRNEDEVSSAKSFRLAGYLPDYRVHGIPNLNATIEKLDDLYLFSLAPQSNIGNRMFTVCCLHEDHFEKARQAVAHRSATQSSKLGLWVTIGGGGRSDTFLEAAPEGMIGALQRLAIDEELQGIDFDCEHFRHQQDFTDYQTLIVQATNVLHNNNVKVSVALHAGQLLSKSVYNAIDRVNLMAYDMAGSSYHADLQLAQKAVTKLLESGCPAHKIFLGIPAYGRHKRQPSEVKTFLELADSALAKGKSIQQIASVKAIDKFQLDSADAVSAKVEYAYSAGLGGVFFWELGQDKQHESAPSGVLLTAAATTAQRLLQKDDASIDEL